MAPRDGKWWSSREENIVGTLGAIGPDDFEAQETPEYIDVEIRLSWAPARLNVVFKWGRTWRKIPPRPDRRRSAQFKPFVYSRAVFDSGARAAFPAVFYIPSEIPGTADDPPVTETDPKARSSRHTSPSRPPRSHIGTDQWHDAQDDWRDSDWSSRWDGRNQFPGEDWKVRNSRQNEKKEEAGRVGRNRRISEGNERLREEQEKEEEDKNAVSHQSPIVVTGTDPIPATVGRN